MLTKPIAPPSFKFPLGWHSILNNFAQEILAVEYLYGDVLASVGIERNPDHPRLRVLLISEAPRELREEASAVLNQIQRRVRERAWETCSICGGHAQDTLVSNCGKHSDTGVVSYAELKPLIGPAWRLADFHMQIDGTQEDVIRTMAGNEQQMDAATSFVKIYDAPEVSQILAQAHALRASWAMEDILLRSAFAAQAHAFESGS
jgi:hypothetical protein